MEREPQPTTRRPDAIPGRGPLVPLDPPDAAARRRTAGVLFTAWLVYWGALLAWQLWPVAGAWWRVRQAGGRGSFTIAYSGEFAEAALWLAGPPLLMALLWLLLARRRSTR